jgi:hypothetical protein
MRSRRIILVALAALLLVPVAAAQAAKKVRTPVGNTDSVLPASFCGYPLALHVLVDREIATTFPDGSQRVHGKLVVRLSNADTGRSLVTDISGPYTVSADGNTVVLHGRSLVSLNASQGGPGVFLTNGKVVLTPAGADFGNARVQDVCAMLR